MTNNETDREARIRLAGEVLILQGKLQAIEDWRKEYFWTLNIHTPTAQRALDKIMEES